MSSFVRGDLFFIKDFDFKLSEPKRTNSKPKPKFLIVLDVKNGDAIFCLTASLNGISTSILKSKIKQKCKTIDEGHFFKFPTLKVSNEFSFKKETYVRGQSSDVFCGDIYSIERQFITEKAAKKVCNIKYSEMIDLLICLSKSKLIKRDMKKWIEEVAHEMVCAEQDRKEAAE